MSEPGLSVVINVSGCEASGKHLVGGYMALKRKHLLPAFGTQIGHC